MVLVQQNCSIEKIYICWSNKLHTFTGSDFTDEISWMMFGEYSFGCLICDDENHSDAHVESSPHLSILNSSSLQKSNLLAYYCLKKLLLPVFLFWHFGMFWHLLYIISVNKDLRTGCNACNGTMDCYMHVW